MSHFLLVIVNKWLRNPVMSKFDESLKTFIISKSRLIFPYSLFQTITVWFSYFLFHYTIQAIRALRYQTSHSYISMLCKERTWNNGIRWCHMTTRDMLWSTSSCLEFLFHTVENGKELLSMKSAKTTSNFFRFRNTLCFLFRWSLAVCYL